MRYQLKKEQQLNCDREKAWRFFSSPGNLATITPPDLDFVVLTPYRDEPIYEGMIIDYNVSPLLGIALKWRTEITQFNYLESFTDFQVKGPYKYWNHLHEFIPNAEGVLMKDTVDYELPFGIAGNIVHALMVKKKLRYIFDYRYRVLEELFNENAGK